MSRPLAKEVMMHGPAPALRVVGWPITCGRLLLWIVGPTDPDLISNFVRAILQNFNNL